MELNEDGFLEDLLALRREAWETKSSSTDDHGEMNGFFSTTSWAFGGLDSTLPNTSTTSYDSFSSSLGHHHHHQQPPPTSLDCASFSRQDFYPGPFEPGLTGPAPDYSMIEAAADEINNNNVMSSSCKAEHSLSSAGKSPPAAAFNVGSFCMEKSSTGKSKVKKIDGQPSKNLMAERRRRKRLNDRLSMLRSVVPKISKMDRPSILGDTIDYMKELLERINNLQEEIDVGCNQLNVMGIFKDVKPSDSLVRNSPKFDVEMRNLDTSLEICCAGKPGLLLSTVTTLEAMGLEIQQCVISCFNDFSLKASCSEEMEQKSMISTEDMKQALFRNAGYGGRCL